jgi:membrane protein YdbS with pleckstrin-like domain
MLGNFTLGLLIAVFGILVLWLMIDAPLWVFIPAAVTGLVGMALMLSAIDEE